MVGGQFICGCHEQRILSSHVPPQLRHKVIAATQFICGGGGGALKPHFLTTPTTPQKGICHAAGAVGGSGLQRAGTATGCGRLVSGAFRGSLAMALLPVQPLQSTCAYCCAPICMPYTRWGGAGVGLGGWWYTGGGGAGGSMHHLTLRNAPRVQHTVQKKIPTRIYHWLGIKSCFSALKYAEIFENIRNGEKKTTPFCPSLAATFSCSIILCMSTCCCSAKKVLILFLVARFF